MFVKFLLALALTFTALSASHDVYAHEGEMCTPPDFPTCESKLAGGPGDVDHSPNGNFEIIGVGWRVGNDDVYRLMDGNYLQCYCPTSGSTTGIQSDWWNVSLKGLTREEIDYYKAHGWFEEQGAQRNLPNYTFLIRNREFSCAQATPTPTPSPTPTVAPTSVPTTVPTATPTQGPQGPISKCYDLEANTTLGNAPLSVTFKGHADDPSQNGKIKEYRFDFGDAHSGGQQVVFQSSDTATHTYNLPGEYEAALRIQDYAGNWRESDECKVKIKVNPAGSVLGITSPEQLPDTGASVGLLTAILVLPGIGYFLYKHFRLV